MTKYVKVAHKSPDLRDSLLSSGLIAPKYLTSKPNTIPEPQQNPPSKSSQREKSPLKSPAQRKSLSPIPPEDHSHRSSKVTEEPVAEQHIETLGTIEPGNFPQINSKRRDSLPSDTPKPKIVVRSERQPKPTISVPPTKIPQKFHRYEKSPILPGVLTNETDVTVYRESAWHKTWFPSVYPADRREVQALSETMDLMLKEIGISTDDDALAVGLFNVNKIEKEQELYDIVLHEIVRQLYVECYDRALLLERVVKRYRYLFYRVPELLAKMHNEIDNLVEANKSLRMLLDRLVKEKRTTESQLNDEMIRLANLEEENVELSKQLLESEASAKELTVERDEVLADVRRIEQACRNQERLNRDLQIREITAKAQIKGLSQQLEETVNKIHDVKATKVR